MTPWYQLTRLIWWPRSPRVAAVVFGLVVGASFGVLGYAGVFAMVAGPSPGDLVVALVQGAFYGTIAAVVAGRVRRRWSELQDLTDVERLTAIHAVHFGEDVGTEPLARATFEFASWQRSRIECRTNEYGLSALGCAGGLAAASALVQAQAGVWGRAIGSGFLAVGLVLASLDGSRRLKNLVPLLWIAEWYAARRLEHSDAG